MHCRKTRRQFSYWRDIKQDKSQRTMGRRKRDEQARAGRFVGEKDTGQNNSRLGSYHDRVSLWFRELPNEVSPILDLIKGDVNPTRETGARLCRPVMARRRTTRRVGDRRIKPRRGQTRRVNPRRVKTRRVNPRWVETRRVNPRRGKARREKIRE